MTRELKPCGTEAAYKRHLRHGETPCAACYEASARDRRIRYADRPGLEQGRVTQAKLLREVIDVLAKAMGVRP